MSHFLIILFIYIEVLSPTENKMKLDDVNETFCSKGSWSFDVSSCNLLNNFLVESPFKIKEFCLGSSDL